MARVRTPYSPGAGTRPPTSMPCSCWPYGTSGPPRRPQRHCLRRSRAGRRPTLEAGGALYSGQPADLAGERTAAGRPGMATVRSPGPPLSLTADDRLRPPGHGGDIPTAGGRGRALGPPPRRQRGGRCGRGSRSPNGRGAHLQRHRQRRLRHRVARRSHAWLERQRPGASGHLAGGGGGAGPAGDPRPGLGPGHGTGRARRVGAAFRALRPPPPHRQPCPRRRLRGKGLSPLAGGRPVLGGGLPRLPARDRCPV